MDRTMDLKKLYPFAGRHAVQSAMLSVNFNSEIEVEDGRAVQMDQAHKELAGDFPVKTDVQQVTFQIGDTSGAGAAKPRLGGWKFVNQLAPGELRPNHPPLRRSISVQGASLQIIEHDYDRWAGYRALIERSLSALGPAVFDERTVRDVALAYSDVFIWKDDPASLEASALFNADSDFLPRNAFAIGSRYFHANHGYYSNAVPDVGASLVENVNIARTPDSATGHDHFIIYIEHRLTPKERTVGVEAGTKLISSVLEFLHQRNKQLLGSLLTPNVREMIKLGV